jgi:ribonuclease HI
LIREILWPHDANEVLKIRVENQNLEDKPAWHYDKNGIFFVKSAYKLAEKIRREAPDASSTEPDGRRGIWKNIWRTKVPNKVKIFGWRLATDNLPTTHNKWRRTLEMQNICKACGNGVEDSFHATVDCTKAKALRSRMRDFWELPKEKVFTRNGQDWLPVMLSNTNKSMHQAILLTLWRSWHLRDDFYHGKGDATIEQSARFLLNYVKNINTDMILLLDNVCTDTKGKKPVDNRMMPGEGNKKQMALQKKVWEPPPMGWLKINVDASSIEATGSGATGIIIRDHTGTILLAGGNIIKHCSTAKEAEAMAIVDGARLSNRWPGAKIIFESDCSTVVKAVNQGRRNDSHLRSTYYSFFDETELLDEWKCMLATRYQNCTAHECAACVRHGDVGVFWFSVFPDRVIRAATLDCNQISFVE